MAFDLDKVVSEADGPEPFEFTFGGDLYQIPGRMDARVMACIRQNGSGELVDADMHTMLRLLLGVDQFKKLMDSPAAFTIEHMGALFSEYAAHQNVTAGESSASASS